MIKEIDKFDRLEIFNHYNSCDNPFLIITTKLDVTDIVDYCKIKNHFYATMGFLVGKSVMNIDNFRYRVKEGKFYYCENIITNYTDILSNGNIGYFDVPLLADYNDYIRNYDEEKQNFLKDEDYMTNNELNEIWISSIPWFKCTNLIPPFDKKNTIPMFFWDKYELENDKYYVNFTILVHHGFVDGSHVAKFINELEIQLKEFRKKYDSSN